MNAPSESDQESDFDKIRRLLGANETVDVVAIQHHCDVERDAQQNAQLAHRVHLHVAPREGIYDPEGLRAFQKGLLAGFEDVEQALMPRLLNVHARDASTCLVIGRLHLEERDTVVYADPIHGTRYWTAVRRDITVSVYPDAAIAHSGASGLLDDTISLRALDERVRTDRRALAEALGLV